MEYNEEHLKELRRLGHVSTVQGSELDISMQQLVALGHARKGKGSLPGSNRYVPSNGVPQERSWFSKIFGEG